ncbi:hypothetical protein NXS98_14250 [Fontisphaera persica]|uniref:hypothetical protein n=1 Tax=Fontisphaera persica TaxID=2974023 RepID=UPI0024BFAEA0|nr:hypothetical protein [Fontisphaera persica]WCJ58870.1 hypothetical protein NXS98_14250 [Fontisphaera persica]
MSNTIKGTTRRLYIADEDLERLKRLSDETNLGQTEILTQIVHAGLVSLEANQNRITFPLRFKILDQKDEPRTTRPIGQPLKRI